MRLLTASHSDKGTRKPHNEDSALLIEAQTPTGALLLAAVADGVGGLTNGELASADIIRTYAQWFEEEALKAFGKPVVSPQRNRMMRAAVKARWEALIQERNQRIKAYGERENIQLGTTFSALLITPDHHYLVGHVGDSRVYHLSDVLRALTSNHTVAAQALRTGRVSAHHAQHMQGQNVLTQCIGVTPKIVPEFIEGKIQPHDVFLLCSDGFYNRISAEELQRALNHQQLTDEASMKHRIFALTELCKKRGEGDNITSLLVKVAE